MLLSSRDVLVSRVDGRYRDLRGFQELSLGSFASIRNGQMYPSCPNGGIEETHSTAVCDEIGIYHSSLPEGGESNVRVGF